MTSPDSNFQEEVKVSYQTLKDRFILIARKNIKIWQVIFIVVFVAGFVGALIYLFSRP